MSWENTRYYLQFPVAVPVSRVRNLRLTTPSAAVRQLLPPEGFHKRLLARLACLIHAANVHSEPGSNPSYDCFPVATPSSSCVSFAGPEGPTPESRSRILARQGSISRKKSLMLDAQVVKPVQSAASRRIQRLKSLNEGHQPICQRTIRRARRNESPETAPLSTASGHRSRPPKAVNRHRTGFSGLSGRPGRFLPRDWSAIMTALFLPCFPHDLHSNCHQEYDHTCLPRYAPGRSRHPLAVHRSRCDGGQHLADGLVHG